MFMGFFWFTAFCSYFSSSLNLFPLMPTLHSTLYTALKQQKEVVFFPPALAGFGIINSKREKANCLKLCYQIVFIQLETGTYTWVADPTCQMIYYLVKLNVLEKTLRCVPSVCCTEMFSVLGLCRWQGSLWESNGITTAYNAGIYRQICSHWCAAVACPAVFIAPVHLFFTLSVSLFLYLSLTHKHKHTTHTHTPWHLNAHTRGHTHAPLSKYTQRQSA